MKFTALTPVVFRLFGAVYILDQWFFGGTIGVILPSYY